jgi:peptide/nickel transport system permease protein
MPNVLIPFVTLLVNTIPIALAGSIVYELVFNIPGMGKLLYDAVYNADWNVVYGMVLFIMIITSFVYIIGDIFYKIIDPRVR